MPVTPTSDTALAIDGLMDMVAQSATFQTLLGAVGNAESKKAVAKAKLFPGRCDESTADMPYGVLALDSQRRVKVGVGFSDTFVHQGSGLILSFFFPTPDQWRGNERDAYYYQLNTTDAIIQEALAFSGAGGYVSFSSVDLVNGPIRSGKSHGEGRDYYVTEYRFTYGP